jgi:4-aminobutyrate aminotransferase-like enzyme
MTVSNRRTTAGRVEFDVVKRSLADLLGRDYVRQLCANAAFLEGVAEEDLRRMAEEPVEFLPAAFQDRLRSLHASVGREVTAPVAHSAAGAGTKAWNAATKPHAAPMGGLGYYRLGEDGRLYLATKAEHYHVPLGHRFPGGVLVDRARALGLNNATHNNTRGHATRVLEEQLVRRANGMAPGDPEGLGALTARAGRDVLNRVINLDTGSLAAEAALKLALSRFYASQPGGPEPEYADRTPVIAVLGDDDGDGLEANYHGTTMLTQVMRGMWGGMRERMAPAMEVRGIRANRIEDFEQLLADYDQGGYKVAAFFHEFIMMNYSAKRLTEDFVTKLYARCRERDIPVVADEIQTCVWSPELFMFREYGVQPDAVVVGKGFPNGHCAASRIIFAPYLDRLAQFGALITNGQEDLAAVSYLVTMEWNEANGEAIEAIGAYYQERLRDLAERHSALVSAIEGKRHLAGVYFDDLDVAKAFVQDVSSGGLDISVQSYKRGCPPCALTKLPLIMDYEAVDLVIERMDRSLAKL